MNILEVQKYLFLTKNNYWNKLSLLILIWETLLENKQKQLKNKEKNK